MDDLWIANRMCAAGLEDVQAMIVRARSMHARLSEGRAPDHFVHVVSAVMHVEGPDLP